MTGLWQINQKEVTKMTENQKTAQKEFQAFFKEMPCAEMMQKMMEAKKAGHGFDCASMMSQMRQMCCRSRDRKEEESPEKKESPTPGQ